MTKDLKVSCCTLEVLILWYDNLPSQINQSQAFENDIDLEETVNEDILLGLLDLVYNESQHEVILSK